MTRIEELSPDRRAVLSLILRRRRSYAEIATALQIDEDSVREHAHAALAEIADEGAEGLNASEREQIGDYLLAQQDAAERLVTYDELEGSAAARAFANAVARELATMSTAPLPEIPGGFDGAAARAPAPRPSKRRSSASQRGRRAAGAGKVNATPRADAGADAEAAAPRADADAGRTAASAGGARSSVPRPSLPSSRLGGAIVLALIVIGAIVAIVLTSTSGGGSAGAKSGTGATSAAAAANGGTGATGQVRLSKQIKLTPPAGGSALGAAAVLSEGGRYVIALAAEHLPATSGFFYAAWLYNSPGQAYALGKAPSVSSNGELKPVAQSLPENASQYRQLLITKETSEHPSQPGEAVLSGPFSLH